MTSPATIASLADMIEKLTGPDREVDAEMALALGVVPEGAFRPCAAVDAGTFATGAYGFWSCEPYTASVDAAMTLVPTDCVWSAGDWRANGGPPSASVWPPERNRPEGYHGIVQAATPALALCAAALRAILQGEQK